MNGGGKKQESGKENNGKENGRKGKNSNGRASATFWGRTKEKSDTCQRLIRGKLRGWTEEN